METKITRENWEILKTFLPKGWEKEAANLGALVRKRKIHSPAILLRVLLIHFAGGKSLRTTATYAKEANICSINDVALLHRLKASTEWLRWMCIEIYKDLKGTELPSKLLNKYRIRLVDGSSISEPGSTGTDWRIHYCFQLNTLKCDSFKITTPKEGETLYRYSVSKNDLMVGDRAYCSRKGIVYTLKHGGHVLIRFHSTNLPLYNRQGKPFPVLDWLRTLKDNAVGDWDVWFKSPEDKRLIKGRLISILKSEEAIEKALKKLRRNASKKGHKLKPETLEHAKYVSLFTTVNRHGFKGNNLLSLYRSRWQIELVFKRLKGIIALGHLPKYNEESSMAWLYGKMLVALLTERLYQEAEFISPWGYPNKLPTGGG
jgi:hypothetical protein